MDQLKAGVILNYVIIGLNTIVGLSYMPYMLRMMGQSEYGLYALAASVIAYLAILDLGFGNAIIRYTAKYRAEGKTEDQYALWGLFTLVYSAIGIITLIIGIYGCTKIDVVFGGTLTPIELERARAIIVLMVFNLAITFPLSIYGAIITAYEGFIFLRVVQIIRILLNTIVMLGLLSMGYKALAMVVVQTIFNIICLLLNFIFCKYRLSIKLRFKKIEWSFLREITLYSFWIFLGIIMERIYWSSGQFVLGATVGTVAVAVFALAIHLQSMYMAFSGAVSNVFLPRVTTMVSNENNPKHISDLFIRVGRIQYIVLAFVLSGFIIFGRQFIALWAGQDYAESYIITLLFFIPLTVPLIQNLGIAILQARNQMKFRSVLYIVIAITSLILQIILSNHYGAIGCAIAISGALTVGQIVIMNIYYQKYQHLDIIEFWREIAKMSFVPLVLCILSYFVFQYVKLDTVFRLSVGIMMFALLYLPLFWRFSMKSQERDLFKLPVLKFFKRISSII